MRHKSLVYLAVLFAAPFLAACPGNEVTVQVLTEAGEEGNLRPVANHVIQFLPYDRDSVFEALAERAETPEPPIPEDLQVAFDSVANLQERWRQLEDQWSETREELRGISNRLQGVDPRAREYRQLFERFNQLEARERQLNRQRTQAFERFDELQRQTLERADSVRAVREAWEDVAFRDYNSVVDSIMDARGMEVRHDTTNADGFKTVRLRGSPWWVHSRISVPFGELYWNVPIDPAEVDTLRLSPENADRRLRM
jgi:hypothetical protein